MKQIYVSPATPIHVSTTGPIYLLSPTGVALRQHRQQRAWLSRRVQTLLLAALAAASLLVLLHPLGGGLPAQELPLAHRRGGSGGRAAAGVAGTGGSQQQQQALSGDASSSSGGGGSGSSNSELQSLLEVQQQQQQQPLQLRQEVSVLAAAATRDLADAPLGPAASEPPVHICCVGAHCLSSSKQRHAVVTYVRSEAQLQAAQGLAASLWRTNPGLDLAVMVVRGELPAEAAEAVEALNATLFYVEPLAGGARAGRGWSWLKSTPASWVRLRATGLTQYDAVLLVEPEARFAGDASCLFALPTDFVVVGGQALLTSSGSSDSSSSTSEGSSASTGARSAGLASSLASSCLGGRSDSGQAAAGTPALLVHAGKGPAFFLRPCAPAEAHMASLLAAATAAGSGGSSGGSSAVPRSALASEPAFLAWYFGPGARDLRLPFDVFVINLESAADRLAHFRRSYSSSDLGQKGYERWPAADGRALDLAALVSPRALEQIEAAQALGYRTKHYQLTRGSVGCYMSHLSLWRAFLERRGGAEHALVFEDDAMLEPELLARLGAARPFPRDWDIMLLGYYCYRCSPLASDRRFIAVRGFFGTHAYLVHRRALRKLFAYPGLLPVGQQIDALMSEMAGEGRLNVYALNEHPMLVDQNNKDFATSVQIPVKRGLWDDPYSRDD